MTANKKLVHTKLSFGQKPPKKAKVVKKPKAVRSLAINDQEGDAGDTSDASSISELHESTIAVSRPWKKHSIDTNWTRVEVKVKYGMLAKGSTPTYYMIYEGQYHKQPPRSNYYIFDCTARNGPSGPCPSSLRAPSKDSTTGLYYAYYNQKDHNGHSFLQYGKTQSERFIQADEPAAVFSPFNYFECGRHNILLDEMKKLKSLGVDNWNIEPLMYYLAVSIHDFKKLVPAEKTDERASDCYAYASESEYEGFPFCKDIFATPIYLAYMGSTKHAKKRSIEQAQFEQHEGQRITIAGKISIQQSKMLEALVVHLFCLPICRGLDNNQYETNHLKYTQDATVMEEILCLASRIITIRLLLASKRDELPKEELDEEDKTVFGTIQRRVMNASGGVRTKLEKYLKYIR